MTTRTKTKILANDNGAVTTKEALPVLDDAARAELLRLLVSAGADIAAGRYTEHDPKTLKDRLARIQGANRR